MPHNSIDHEAIHAEVMQDVYKLSQRTASYLIMRPEHIDTLYKAMQSESTPKKARDVYDLLKAIVHDAHHNPIAADPRAARFNEIRHEIAFLHLADLLHYNEHPTCFMAYLVNTYPQARPYLISIELGELKMLEEAVALVLEVRMRS